MDVAAAVAADPRVYRAYLSSTWLSLCIIKAREGGLVVYGVQRSRVNDSFITLRVVRLFSEPASILYRHTYIHIWVSRILGCFFGGNLPICPDELWALETYDVYVCSIRERLEVYIVDSSTVTVDSVSIR